MGGPHQLLGLSPFASIFAQAVLGWYHHVLFKQRGSRTMISYMHIALGWLVMCGGWINTVLLVKRRLESPHSTLQSYQNPHLLSCASTVPPPANPIVSLWDQGLPNGRHCAPTHAAMAKLALDCERCNDQAATRFVGLVRV